MKRIICCVISLVFAISSVFSEDFSTFGYDQWKKMSPTIQQREYLTGFITGFVTRDKRALGENMVPEDSFIFKKDIAEIQELVDEIYDSPKYRDLSLPVILEVIVTTSNRNDLFVFLDKKAQDLKNR